MSVVDVDIFRTGVSTDIVSEVIEHQAVVGSYLRRFDEHMLLGDSGVKEIFPELKDYDPYQNRHDCQENKPRGPAYKKGCLLSQSRAVPKTCVKRKGGRDSRYFDETDYDVCQESPRATQSEDQDEQQENGYQFHKKMIAPTRR